MNFDELKHGDSFSLQKDSNIEDPPIYIKLKGRKPVGGVIGGRTVTVGQARKIGQFQKTIDVRDDELVCRVSLYLERRGK